MKYTRMVATNATIKRNLDQNAITYGSAQVDFPMRMTLLELSDQQELTTGRM